MEDSYMAIITQYQKDTDTTYVYESVSYWDPDKQQSRSKRRCIGKIDPETGKTIPTGKRGRKKKQADDGFQEVDGASARLAEQLSQAREEISTLKVSNADLASKLKKAEAENRRLKAVLDRIQSLSAEAIS